MSTARQPPGFEGLFTTSISGEFGRRIVTAEVSEGPDKGRAQLLGTSPIVVGTSGECDFRLSDASVSRQHLSLAVVEEGVHIRDLSSRNGTFVDGKRVTNAIAPLSAVITVGTSTLAFSHDVISGVSELRHTLGSLTARSRTMRVVFSVLDRVSRTDATVLLEGETGVGKDVVARAIHEVSARSSKPFVVLDCSAIAPDLMASELFGHRRGAFTGASEDRAGLFETARGGTLFLDEIGEMPKEQQTSLLRVLENRQVRRVGESHVRDVDVRVLAATNRDLEQEVREQRFREDLFHRLAIVRVLVPPLRERTDDITELAEQFLAENGRSLEELSPADRTRLLEYTWPGNVRELRNTIVRSAALSRSTFRLVLPRPGAEAELTMPTRAAPSAASPQSTPPVPPSRTARPPPPVTMSVPALDGWPPDIEDLSAMPLKEARAVVNACFEQAYSRAVLSAHDGNVAKAAEHADVARTYLYKLLRKHDEA